MDRVREGRRLPKCTHTHRGATVQFSVKLCFSTSFYLGQNSFLVYIIFRTPTQSLWSHLPPTHRAWTCLLSSMSLTQPTWNFRRGTPVSCLPLEIRGHPIILPTQSTWHFHGGASSYIL